eukprot:6110380-Alexandrium_andersonii.AAC.1
MSAGTRTGRTRSGTEGFGLPAPGAECCTAPSYRTATSCRATRCGSCRFLTGSPGSSGPRGCTRGRLPSCRSTGRTARPRACSTA